jgi:glutamate synthase (ferredoxin)
MTDLRSRVVLEADGQMKTGRDVAIACLLGAEEFGFGTAPLVVCGCIMMRVCHLNTCPAGVATQDPELRKKFKGDPQHVINFFMFVAEELRKIMAELGFRTVTEMIGRVDKLKVNNSFGHGKTKGLDFSRILYKPEADPSHGVHFSKNQDHGLAKALDNKLIELAKPALLKRKKVKIDLPLRNTNRTTGTMLSSEISRKFGEEGLPEDTIEINFTGSAGQSFAAFAVRGLTMRVEGDANDYFCKGLSGARVIIYPAKNSTYPAEENILIGNVALYGATGGELFARGKAGERFCVRNSGATAIVEGVGDHGCEYMTGGVAVILGSTGRNFAAGMSGGIAYVLDEDGEFALNKCNKQMVDLEGLIKSDEIAKLHKLILKHYNYTGSTVAQKLLDNWNESIHKFVKIMPIEYKNALRRLANEGKEPVSLA